MIYSMTAFSKYEKKYTWGHVSWEIRSLNQRYLEICVDVPKRFFELSWLVRKRIQQRLNRGKIESILRLKINNSDINNISVFNINKSLAHNLILSVRWIQSQINNEGIINPLDILSWPGVIIYEENDLNSIGTELLLCFDKALSDLVNNRKVEGALLKECIVNRICSIQEEVNRISEYVPFVLEMKRKKLLEQMQDVYENIDSVKLEQELLTIAQKIDISEEIDRLIAHIQAVHDVLSDKEIGSPVGRQLDFIIQELHREANTLTAKSIDVRITRLAISIKMFIDQIREQVQNIE